MKLSKPDNTKRQEYENYYMTLPQKISINYLNAYKVHVPHNVILRVALDTTVKGQWSKTIERPAYKHINSSLLKQVVYKFQGLLDPKTLLAGISESNSYREYDYVDPNLIKALEKIANEPRQGEVQNTEHGTEDPGSNQTEQSKVNH